MRSQRVVGIVVALSAMLGLTGATTPNVSRMFPAFVMFRGGNLNHPVVIGHTNLRTVTVTGRTGTDVSGDPLANLYQTLTKTDRDAPDTSEIAAKFEVAEYFGPQWMGLEGPDGQPKQELHFDEANHYSTLYVMRKGPMLWRDPVVAPGGGSYFMLSLSDTAEAILKRNGLRVR